MTDEQLELAHELALNEVARLREELAEVREENLSLRELRTCMTRRYSEIRDHVRSTNSSWVQRPSHVPEGSTARVLLPVDRWDELLEMLKVAP